MAYLPIQPPLTTNVQRMYEGAKRHKVGGPERPQVGAWVAPSYL